MPVLSLYVVVMIQCPAENSPHTVLRLIVRQSERGGSAGQLRHSQTAGCLAKAAVELGGLGPANE